MKTLQEAVCEMDFERCEQLLKAGSDVKWRDDKGSTLLHILAKKCTNTGTKAEKIVSLLLDHDANISAKNIDNDTPLHIAAKDGVKEFCDILLKRQKKSEKKSDKIINKQNKKGLTPLHYAARRRSQSIVEYLIGEGADTNIPDNQKYLPLHHAALAGCCECCKVLFKCTAKDTLDGSTVSPITLAANKGHHLCYDSMKGFELDRKDKEGNTALHVAAKMGFDVFAKKLITDGASLDIKNKQGNTPVMEAVLKNKMSCVKLLTENKAALGIKNNKKRGVLHLAALKRLDECIEYLLDQEEVFKYLDDEDKWGNTALYIAVEKQNEKGSMMLLNAEASPCVASEKESLLHLAIKSDKMALFQELMKSNKFDVNGTSENNRETPLHVAAKTGSKDICQWLLRRGATIDALDKKGRTALHLSSFNGHASVVKLLKSEACNVHQRDDENGTALHSAAYSGDQECCKLLMAADKSLFKEKDKKGRYAMDIACSKGHYSLFQFLLQQIPNNHPYRPHILDYIHDHTHKALKNKNK